MSKGLVPPPVTVTDKRNRRLTVFGSQTYNSKRRLLATNEQNGVTMDFDETTVDEQQHQQLKRLVEWQKGGTTDIDGRFVKYEEDDTLAQPGP
jgi:predicted HAD superfamily phosphohydrolase YqeG